MKEELERKEGIAMLIFLLSITIFAFNATTGILVSWAWNYNWSTMSFPTVSTRLLVCLWVVQGISWLTTASSIFSWVYMKKIEKKKLELKQKH